MSVWTTKAYGDEKNYIVMKHTVPGVNHTINGVKFRAGYAVVSKPSKTYSGLKKLPVLKNARELPITFLAQLPFITRAVDIKIVYGSDVYYSYQKAMKLKLEEEAKIEKVEEIKQHLADESKCQMLTKTSGGEELCGYDSIENSGGFCIHHILEAPIVQDLGIEIPTFLTKQERKQLRHKVAEQVRKAKKVE